MGNAFFDTTRVWALGDGFYEGAVHESWNLRPLPQGGIVTAIALRAMTDSLGDESQSLRTLHTAFIGQVTDGPVEVQVDVLRRGRSMSHVRGAVANPGRAAGHVTTAIFGGSRSGFAFTDLRPPRVPPPGECRSFRDPPPPGFDMADPMPFWALRIEARVALGHAPWDEYVPDRAETASWYRFDEPPFLDDGTMDPLALLVLVDTMPGAVNEKVGRTAQMWFAPSVDLTVHLLDECRSGWLLAHNTARFAGDGYASADMALWDCGPDGADDPRLVAYGTQLFLFTFL